jgi:hypothetical protein
VQKAWRFALDHELRNAMTLEGITLALFTLCNTFRLLGYLPQLLRSTRDQSGGSSTSVTTWAMFSTANASTAAYAVVHSQDALMALLFSLNTLCCMLITSITLWKRQSLPVPSFLRSRRSAAGEGRI